MKQAVSNAGIKCGEDGGQEVPASRRSDGSTRAPIRIRPGYIPTEDKPKYKPPPSRESIVAKPQAAGLSPKAREYVPVVKEQDKASTITHVSNVPVVKKEQDEASTITPQESASYVRQTLASWSSAGWRGDDDTPSRYATKIPTQVVGQKIPKLVPQNTVVSGSPKTKSDATKVTAKELQSRLLALNSGKVKGEEHTDGASDPDLVALEQKLNKVNLDP